MAFGSIVSGAFGKSLGAIAGGILGDAFGGDTRARFHEGDARKQYKLAEEFTGFQARVNQAKAAGLHPLFAMGSSGGSSPGFAIPGQSRQGSFAKKAIAEAGTRMGSALADKTQLVNAQAALSAVELARHSLSNDTAGQMTLPRHRPAFQEIQKGRTDAHMTKHPEQSLNVKSPLTQIRVGSQKVWLPLDEVDEFFENPLAIGAAVYAYHGNKNINWSKLFREYTGKQSLTQYMRDNIRKNVPVKVRKEHLLKKYAKPWAGGPSP